MAIEKITNSTQLSRWAEIINEINDATVTNAESIINSVGSVYTFTQRIDTDGSEPDNSESFEQALARFLEENKGIEFKKNDVAIVTLVDASNEGTTYEMAAYIYDGEKWVACTGAVDADKVIMREDITLAGNYTQVGNLTKSSTGTSTFATKGKSMSDILLEMLSKRLQPAITQQPSVNSFNLTSPSQTSVEAGTTFNNMSYSGGGFEDGAYTYESSTGVTVTNWKVDRVTNLATTTVKTVDGATLSAGTDDNGGNGFQIGDSDGTFGDSSTPVVSTVKYTATATHTAGNLAKDNLGSPCTNSTQIASGSKSKTTGTVTCYRNYFYGATTTTDSIDSAYIRNLTKSNKAYAATSSLKITTTPEPRRIVIACIDGKPGVTKVTEPNLHADVSGSFTKSQVEVEGANGYAAKTYNVWVWETAKPWGESLTYTVTLG